MPPLTCYGSGKTVEAAREEAATNALKPLLQLGLDRSSALKSLEESQGEAKLQHSLFFPLILLLSFLKILGTFTVQNSFKKLVPN